MIEKFATRGAEINLGKEGENLAVTVVFDVLSWVRTYGEGHTQLLHRRCRDTTPYPCTITVKSGKVYWPVTSADVAVAGRGYAELQYYVGAVCVKSETYRTSVDPALGTAGATPPAVAALLERYGVEV